MRSLQGLDDGPVGNQVPDLDVLAMTSVLGRVAGGTGLADQPTSCQLGNCRASEDTRDAGRDVEVVGNIRRDRLAVFRQVIEKGMLIAAD